MFVRPEVWLSFKRQEHGCGANSKRRKGAEGKEVQELIDRLKPTNMTLTLRNDFGCTEAVIAENCGFDTFYSVADLLAQKLHIRFTNKIDDSNTSYWDFNFNGHKLTLHYNVYDGISIFPVRSKASHAKDNEAVEELAHQLEQLN